jgi:hypothetical protein
MEWIYDYTHLEKNISDMIFEGLIKIGYVDKQRISVYYDLGLLSYLLGVEMLAFEQWRECFSGFKAFTADRLIGLEIKRQGHRFEFSVSGEGVDYIYKNNKSRKFLKELIAVLNRTDCTLEQITDVFQKVSEDIVIEKASHPEFQYVIYFKDKEIDEFKYCISFDEMGHYYHRLLDYDFEKVISCEH